MSNPYGHIGYFHHSTTEDDESDGISSIDNAHIATQSRAALNDDEGSVGSGILRIRNRVQELESVFSHNLTGRSEAPRVQDEEQRSEATHETADVGTLRKELEDADRIHSLSLQDYLQVLDVKPAAKPSTKPDRHMTSDPESNAVPLESLTWSDLMKVSASRSASAVDSDSCMHRDEKEKVPASSVPVGDVQDNDEPSSRRRNRIAWIMLLCCIVIGIILAVVFTTTASSRAKGTDLPITGVANSKDAFLGDTSDSTPDTLQPVQAPSSPTATKKPSEPKGPGGSPPSPTKAPTLKGTSNPTKAPTFKGSSNPTKSPSIPNQQPSSIPVIPNQPVSFPSAPTGPSIPNQQPSSIPVIPNQPIPFPSAPSVPTGPSALRDQVALFLQQEYGVDFENPHAISSLNWLLSEGVDSVNHKMAQRFTLKVMDFSLRDDAATSEGTWNAEKWTTRYLDECRWNGVTCSEEGLVSELNLGGRKYGGRIPNEIRILQRSLEILDLSKNDISGTIPEDLFQLTGLKRAYLYQNKLSGIFSPSWALLQDLTHLHLSHNRLSSTLPNELRRMTTLRYLNLYRNQISGRLPHYMKYMSSLWFLDLGRNMIEQDLPNGWGDGMVSLQHLYLDHNRIDKYIPASYNNLGNSKLQVLVLNDNNLTGSVPLKSPQLVTLNVHNNRLTGSIGSDVCAMSIFGSGRVVDFSADCSICDCEGFFCDQCSR